jgi:hypothetical protein
MSKDILIIRKGATFKRRIEYFVDNQPRNLTDYHARMQFRPNPTSNQIDLTLSSSIGIDGSGLNLTPFSGSVQLPLESGSIGIQISAYSSSLLPSDQEAYFDLFIMSGSGLSYYSELVYEGKAKFISSITR